MPLKPRSYYMYKEPFINSGTGAAIWSQSNFGPTVQHHPRSNPFSHVCTVPSTSEMFKCGLLCEGVRHRL
jgi:hypothetical protein